MITEIYTRSLKDSLCDSSKLEHNDPIEEIIQKIKMILSTNKGDVLGDFHLGCNIEDLVFKTKNDAKYIETEISSQISEYIPADSRYVITSKVRFGRSGNGSDYALIDILINEQKVTSVLVS